MLPRHMATIRSKYLRSLLSKQLSLGNRVPATPHLHRMQIWPSCLWSLFMAKQSPIKRITKCKVLPGSGVGICNDHFVSLEEVGDSTRCWWMYRLLLVSLFSKLRMLEFYYDCIDRFVDRKDFQYIKIARIWRSLLLWRAYSNQEWRGSLAKSIGCSSLDVPVSLTTQLHVEWRDLGPG